MMPSYIKTFVILFGLSLFSVTQLNAQEDSIMPIKQDSIMLEKQDSVKVVQRGYVTINQSPEINRLLSLKKGMNVEEDRFKIQIYSGNRSAAEAAKGNFDEAFPQYYSRLEYETPNYKIWIGNFRSRLEADRALLKVKRKFTSAFIFKPGK